MAQALKVTLRSYQKYEHGEILPSEAVIELLSLKFNVNPRWLLTGEGEMFLPEDWPPPGAMPVRKIPVYGHVPAGWPEQVESREDPLSFIYIPRDWAPPGTIALVVQGDSMTPTLKNGEIVLVEPLQGEPKNGTVVVAAYLGGEYTIKEFRKTNGKILLIPHNPEYRTIVIEDPAAVDLQIIGRVRRVVSIREIP